MSGQHLPKQETFLLSEGNSALLPAKARYQTVTKGGMIMMRLTFTLIAQHEESYITNHLMTDLSENSEFCFP